MILIGDTNTDLNEIVSTSLDTSYSQEVIQNNNKNESLKITQTMIVTRTLPKMIMNLIMQIKEIR